MSPKSQNPIGEWWDIIKYYCHIIVVTTFLGWVIPLENSDLDCFTRDVYINYIRYVPGLTLDLQAVPEKSPWITLYRFLYINTLPVHVRTYW